MNKKKKYEFKRIDEDVFKLIYTHRDKEEEIEFTRDIGLTSLLQSINARARREMYKELTINNLTKRDFLIEKTGKNGEKIIDETNFIEYEKTFIEKVEYDTAVELFKKLFKKDITQLITEIGLTTDAEMGEFIDEFKEIIVGGVIKGSEETPSIPDKKKEQ